MSADEPGVLGNLPRSRPGTRSGKRDAAKAGSARTASARKPASTTPRAAKAKAPRPAGVSQPQPASSGDAVTGALKGAARAAGAGLRVADGLTREVLRRLPRR